MAAICGNVGVRVGSEWCLNCVIHGCSGYKEAKKNMGQDSRAFLKLIGRTKPLKIYSAQELREKEMGVSTRTQEFDKDRMNGKEKNPKQVLIDWVINVESSAEEAREHVQKYVKGDSSSGHLNSARENLSCILGQCEAMMTVLKNSD